MKVFKFLLVTFFVLFSFNLVQADNPVQEQKVNEPINLTGIEVEVVGWSTLQPGSVVFINTEAELKPVVVEKILNDHQASVRDFQGLTFIVKDTDLLNVGGRADGLVVIEGFSDEKDRKNLEGLIKEWGRRQFELQDANVNLQRAEVEMETARRHLETAGNQADRAQEQTQEATREVIREKEAQQKRSDALTAIKKANEAGQQARELLEEAAGYEHTAEVSQQDYNNSLEQLRNRRAELSAAHDELRQVLPTADLLEDQIDATEKDISKREAKHEDNLREEIQILKEELERLNTERAQLDIQIQLKRTRIHELETAGAQATGAQEEARIRANNNRIAAENARTKAIDAVYEASFAEERALKPVEAAQMRVELVPNDFRQVVASQIQIYDGFNLVFRGERLDVRFYGESGRLNIDAFEESMLHALPAIRLTDVFTNTKSYLNIFDPRNYEGFKNTTEKTRTAETMYVVNGFDYDQASVAKPSGPLTRTEQQYIADTLYTWMDRTIDQFLALNPTSEEIAQLIEYASYYEISSIKGRGVELVAFGLHQKLLEHGVKQARSAHEFAQLFVNRVEEGRTVVGNAGGFIRLLTILEESVAFYNYDRFLELDPTLEDVRLLVDNLGDLMVSKDATSVFTDLAEYAKQAEKGKSSHDHRVMVQMFLVVDYSKQSRAGVGNLIKLFARELRMGRVDMALGHAERIKLETVFKHNGYKIKFDSTTRKIISVRRTVPTAVADGTMNVAEGVRDMKDRMVRGVRRALKTSGVAREVHRAEEVSTNTEGQRESFAQRKAREFREILRTHGSSGRVRVK